MSLRQRGISAGEPKVYSGRGCVSISQIDKAVLEESIGDPVVESAHAIDDLRPIGPARTDTPDRGGSHR